MPGPWRLGYYSSHMASFTGFNLNRDARPLATNTKVLLRSHLQCFNLNRDARPLATKSFGSYGALFCAFQSQPRCQAPGDPSPPSDCLQYHYSGTSFSRGGSKPPPPGRLNKQAATSGELAEPLPPVLTPPWSTPGWVPDVGCSCGCGSVDVRARPLWGRATHDEP